MSRFKQVADEARREGRKLAGIFLTNGFPDLETSRELLHVIDEAGADFVEIGMPFSDPLAEGLPIQRSSARALAHGVRMRDAFGTVASFRQQSETPVYLMGYVNPILAYGPSNFCRDARSSGVDGLILPDLPPDDTDTGIREAAEAEGLDMVFLIAPNSTDARIAEVDRATTGFVYAVTVAGLTGTDLGERGVVGEYLGRARRLVQRNPLLVGFGIKTAEDARRLSEHTAGFIVGSALVSRIEALWVDPSLSAQERTDGVRRFIEDLAEARLAAQGLHGGE